MSLYIDSPLDRPGCVEIQHTGVDVPVDQYNITPAMISDTQPLAIPIRGIESSVAGVAKIVGGKGLSAIVPLPAARRSGVITQIFATGTDAALKAADSNGNTPLIGLI